MFKRSLLSLGASWMFTYYVDFFKDGSDVTLSLSEYDVEMNDLTKHYVFENANVSTPNKRTAILAKGSQNYSQQNEDGGGGICVEAVQIIKIRNTETQTDEPRDIILQKLEELKTVVEAES